MTNVSDNFNRAGPGLGANWTTATGFSDVNIASSIKAAASATSTHCVAYWNANSFQDDQFSELTLVDFFGGSFVGPTLRHQPGASNSFYVTYASASGTTIFKWRNGSAFQLQTSGTTWTAGDVIRFEVSGSTLTCKKNGSTVASVTDITDFLGGSGDPYTSGSPGIDIFAAILTDGTADNWSAGPLVGAGVVQLINSDGSVELVDSDGLVG